MKRRWQRLIAALLSIACLFVMSGCQASPDKAPAEEQTPAYVRTQLDKRSDPADTITLFYAQTDDVLSEELYSFSWKSHLRLSKWGEGYRQMPEGYAGQCVFNALVCHLEDEQNTQVKIEIGTRYAAVCLTHKEMKAYANGMTEEITVADRVYYTLPQEEDGEIASSLVTDLTRPAAKEQEIKYLQKQLEQMRDNAEKLSLFSYATLNEALAEKPVTDNLIASLKLEQWQGPVRIRPKDYAEQYVVSAVVSQMEDSEEYSQLELTIGKKYAALLLKHTEEFEEEDGVVIEGDVADIVYYTLPQWQDSEIILTLLNGA